MNFILAAGLFDSPWVIVVIVLVGWISNWLMKRRQAEALATTADNEALPSPGQEEPPARPADVQDFLRELLGGQPPPAATPPPIPRVPRDAQTVPVEMDRGLTLNRPEPLPSRGAGTARRPAHHDTHGFRVWGDRNAVRRAFVASLIFAPPKGLEA